MENLCILVCECFIHLNGQLQYGFHYKCTLIILITIPSEFKYFRFLLVIILILIQYFSKVSRRFRSFKKFSQSLPPPVIHHYDLEVRKKWDFRFQPRIFYDNHLVDFLMQTLFPWRWIKFWQWWMWEIFYEYYIRWILTGYRLC